ncbi:MAG: permease-like cell division protein FtsX [Candidatus Taylorbacteria bacterium]|nr:permease-like cell division protein FtsX [Candidatus Taylorbacteria bacterium]
MILTSFKRIIKTGFVDFWRNGFLSFAAIVVITLALLSVGGLIFAGAFGRTLLKEVKSQVDINVYFSLQAPESLIIAFSNEVKKLPEVSVATYVSRDQALALFKAKWQNNALIMQGLDELGSNPFPASINIKAKEPGQYGGIANYLEKKNPTDDNGTPIIEKINYEENKLIIDRLGRIIPTVEQGGLIVAIILAIVAIIVVFNTIRLITYTARDEISVMKLVGASNVFVRGPLVVSGIIYGVISGVITLVLLAVFAYWSDTAILRLAGVDVAQNFSFAIDVFSSYFTTNLGQLFGIIMGTGVILGGVSSYVAARRYLHV